MNDIVCNQEKITAVMQNHDNGRKSWHATKIMVFPVIVYSWFSCKLQPYLASYVYTEVKKVQVKKARLIEMMS